jgi:peptide/nickel transport system ATP-binding protein
MSDALLQVKDLNVVFGQGDQQVKAVSNVSFAINAGEILGLVGESGSGKSTIGRAVLRLVPAASGEVLWRGRNVLNLSARDMQSLRSQMQMVFQDASLNPRQRVGAMIEEVLGLHTALDRAGRRAQMQALLQRVGLRADQSERYPHEFSGGQKQRLGIARALAAQPAFIIADEPVSALDVSIQAQVLNLLTDLQRELGLTMLFISHDLDVVEYLCDRVVVLYLGRVMEVASKKDLFDAPAHPYTVGLLKAAPLADPMAPAPEITLQGEPPSPLSPPSGCVFRTRCPHAKGVCAEEIPVLREVAADRWVACVRYEDIAQERAKTTALGGSHVDAAHSHSEMA